jgi:hypothetical protein
MIDAMVRKKLVDTSSISALVSTRIYVDEQPDPATLPSITVHTISDVPDKDVGKGGFARVQVSCWSEPGKPKNPAPVEAVVSAVKAVFHKPRMNSFPFKLTAGSTSYNVTSSVCTGGVRLIDPTTGWYHVPVDIELNFKEV